MREIDLNKTLETYQSPEPSDLLKARILKAARAENAAATPTGTSFTKRYMSIAASLVAICAIGFTVLQSPETTITETASETAAWQEAATDLGFDDIYDWVETEETSAQES
jgi:hypothetical protein